MKNRLAVISAILLAGGLVGASVGVLQLVGQRDEARAEVQRLQQVQRDSARDFAACDASRDKLRSLAADSLTQLFQAEPILEECSRRYKLKTPAWRIDTR